MSHVEAVSRHLLGHSGAINAPVFAPTPTGERFIRAATHGPVAEMRVLILMGPRGAGKTTAGAWALVALAKRLQRERSHALPIVCAVVRDTWTNLLRTTIETLEENRRKGLPIEFSDGRQQAVILDAGAPLVKLHFFGLDRPVDADKLQGFTCGVLWIEEAAPAAGLATGVPAEAFGLGATSVRQPGVPWRILLTLNPPDEDHWVLKVEEVLAQHGVEDVLVERFQIPPTEKRQHFARLAAEARTEDERAAWHQAERETELYERFARQALESIGRSDLVARLVEGRIGGIQTGEAVVPHFDRGLHVAKESIGVVPGSTLIRCWDAGGCPSVCVLQVLQTGDVDVLGSATLVNKGMHELIRDWLLPFQRKYELVPLEATPREGYRTGRRLGHPFRDIGDPSMATPSYQTTSEDSSRRVVEEMLRTHFEPGPVSWDARREALGAAFWRPGTGGRLRFVQIDPTENEWLIKALAGRAHYPRDQATGRIDFSVAAMKRVSAPWHNVLDALAYGLAQLYPADALIRQVAAWRPPAAAPSPRARSWLGR